MRRILLIEDNQDLAYGLANNLEIEGYDVEVEHDGAAGQRHALEDTPDLLILDLMLPSVDGFRILRTIRENDIDIPVLILSARGEQIDKVQGFRLGADDYVTKPFAVLELLARVEALLRRAMPREQNGSGPGRARPQTFGRIRIEPSTRTVLCDGEEVPMAPKEYELLIALIRRDGAVVSRYDLLQEVWGYSGQILTRTIDTHIAQLRRKLESDPAHPEHILTVRKVGYRFRP